MGQNELWTENTVSPGAIKDWHGLAMTPDGSTQTAVVKNGNIWSSSDSGATWIENTVSPGSTKGWFDIAMSADGSIRGAVGVGLSLWTSIDSGSTWIESTNKPKTPGPTPLLHA